MDVQFCRIYLLFVYFSKCTDLCGAAVAEWLSSWLDILAVTKLISKTMRKKCLPVYYYRNPNTFKFERLFNCTVQNTLNMLCKFIHVIKERVQPPG